MATQTDIEKPPPGGSRLRHALLWGAALLFLALVSLRLPHMDAGDSFRTWLKEETEYLWVLGSLWALVLAEGTVGIFLARDAWSRRLKRWLLTALLPPFRMTVASSAEGGWIWFPTGNWGKAGEATYERLEHRFAWPMVFLTLLILPVLAAELAYSEKISAIPGLTLATHLTLALIWFGFAAEFIYMVTAAANKIRYCTKHWIHIVIILLPVVAFLRVLNIFRFGRMMRLGKLFRAYRLRGLWTRLWRLALLFDLIGRLQQRNPAKYLQVLDRKIAEAETGLDSLRARRAQVLAALTPPVSPDPGPQLESSAPGKTALP